MTSLVLGTCSSCGDELRVKFDMNFPHASHVAGVWERMIRSARVALTSLMKHHASSLDDELLRTLLEKAEANVTACPLTCVKRDVEPLTPAQLLTLKSKAVTPLGIFMKKDLYCCKR